MMPRRRGNKTDANYPEDLVGFALESFLAFFTFPFSTYSIEPFSRGRERWLGADARLTGTIKGFSPLYLQFKRPFAYESASSSKIIKDRRSHQLRTDPRALFFPLRDKQPDHHDYQHNILLKLSTRLRKRGLGDAAYVCPLFLDRSAYRVNVHLSAMSHRLRFWRLHPFELNDLIVRDAAGRHTLDRVPLLSEHVCIRPHGRVSDAKHHYSFSEEGTDLCFHSPTPLPEHIKSMSRWLAEALIAFTESPRELRYAGGNALEGLRHLVGADDEESPIEVPAAITEAENGIEAWYRFGDFLEREYAISQFAIVEWSVE